MWKMSAGIPLQKKVELLGDYFVPVASWQAGFSGFTGCDMGIDQVLCMLTDSTWLCVHVAAKQKLASQQLATCYVFGIIVGKK